MSFVAWLSAMLLIGAFKNMWNATEAHRAILALGLLASLVAWYVHGLFDAFVEFTPTYVAFWLIAGLALSTGVSRDADRI